MFIFPFRYLHGTRILAKLVKETVAANKVHVIYLTGVPYPNHMCSRARNPYLARVLNAISYSWLQGAGATVLDVGEMLYSVSEQDVCGGHYLCINPQEELTLGKYGPGVADLIVSAICKSPS